MRVIFVAFLLTLFFVVNCFSAVKVWTGNGADNNWQTNENWADNAAPNANDELVFPSSSSNFITNNDFPTPTEFKSIKFEGGAYTINGNIIKLTPEREADGIDSRAGVHKINASVNINSIQFMSIATNSKVTFKIVDTQNQHFVFTDTGKAIIEKITGSGSFTINALGILEIQSAENFFGGVSINKGKLIVNADMPNSFLFLGRGSPPIGLSNVGILGGNGFIQHIYSLTGRVLPGNENEIGSLETRNDLVLTNNSHAFIKIGETTNNSRGYDQLVSNAGVSIENAELTLTQFNNYSPFVGEKFIIVKNNSSGAINGTFENSPEGSLVFSETNNAYKISYQGGDGNDVELTAVNQTAFDFDGDGRSDVSQYQPNNGNWKILQSTNSNNRIQQFGLSEDRITPADFDGDGLTDFAVFRPSNGTWYVLNSADSSVTIIQFGLENDIPIPNDFDGDEKADLAVFRPSQGVWYQLRSETNSIVVQQFGLDGDIPLMSDFDGDNIGDLAIYRDGFWHFIKSETNEYNVIQLGISSDIPIPADYNGDGKTDFAVFRANDDPDQPDFYILNSNDFSFSGASWGITDDLPVVADYDGDGRADISVFRPSTNQWFLLQSSIGFGSITFGELNDKPIPSAFQ